MDAERNLLRTMLLHVPNPDKNAADEDSRKWLCINVKGEQSYQINEILIYLPDPPKTDSGSETDLSIQGYETSWVKNSSYDSWSSDDYYHLEEEDIFSVEYDVRSLSSENASVISDTDSDIADIFHPIIIVRQNDTDIEFWADDSSDDSSESELSEGDNWTCNLCGSMNRHTMRFCHRCWEESIGSLPSRRIHPPHNLRRRQRSSLFSRQKVIEKIPGKVKESCDDVKQGSELLDTHTIHNAKSYLEPDSCKKNGILLDSAAKKEASRNDSQVSLGICPLCLHRQKTASIIHGRTGHQMCCYPCARHLESKNLPCPICRRTIQKVVRNYIA